MRQRMAFPLTHEGIPMIAETDLLRLLDEMIEHQQQKVLAIARQLAPGLTAEDIRNPHDFKELADNQRFNFEDGILSGYLGMRMAIQAELRKR